SGKAAPDSRTGRMPTASGGRGDPRDRDGRPWMVRVTSGLDRRVWERRAGGGNPLGRDRRRYGEAVRWMRHRVAVESRQRMGRNAHQVPADAGRARRGGRAVTLPNRNLLWATVIVDELA